MMGCQLDGIQWRTKKKDGLYENYCRNPFNDATGLGCYTSVDNFDKNGDLKMSNCQIPQRDACSCMPPCDQRNPSKCGCLGVLQAEECCKVEEGQEKNCPCRCGYLKEACCISLEKKRFDFCNDDEAACCLDDSDSNCCKCKCSMYKQMCIVSPNNITCGFAATTCCIPVESCCGIQIHPWLWK